MRVVVAGIGLGCWVLATACTTPEARPLVEAEIARSVASRASATRAILSDAWALYDVPPLGLDLPDTLDPTHDAGRDAYWHAHALALQRDIRAARRAWRAQRAAIGAAGIPDRVGITASVDDTSDTSRQQDVAATVDLLGLLGLGRSAAERDVVVQLADAALGQLEQVAWRTVFAVDAARIQFAVARQRERAMAALIGESRRDLERLMLLDDRGRLAPGALGRARAVVAALETDRSLHAVTSARAGQQLAHASGLPPDAPALGIVGDGWLTDVDMIQRVDPRDTEHPLPSPEDLIACLPHLRSAVLDYALAEARVRRAAASAWPDLRVGPRMKLLPDNTLTGGVISFDLPWPSAVEARIERSLEDREAAREAVEDRLVEALANLTARRRELVLAQEHRERDVQPLVNGSLRAWSAARARMSIREDLDSVETWTDALRLRAEGVTAAWDAAERVVLAQLAYREAAGIGPGLDALLREAGDAPIEDGQGPPGGTDPGEGRP